MALRWPFLVMIAAGSIAIGGCGGVVMGNYTVTGGLSPGAGWQMPSFGTDEAMSAISSAASTVRAEPDPAYAGYYPAQASDMTDPAYADIAARDFDALYDQPADDGPVYEGGIDDGAAFEPAIHRGAGASSEAGVTTPTRRGPDGYWAPIDPTG